MAKRAGPLVHPSTSVSPTALIDADSRRLQTGDWRRSPTSTSIGPECAIGHFSIIENEAVLGSGVVVGPYVHVGRAAVIGDRGLLIHRATVGARARVGDDAVIGGWIGERSVVGRGCRVFGSLVHRQLDPTLPWDAPDAMEGSPRIGDGAFIGWGASVIGDITVGPGAYVCAGAVVTKDIPAGLIVSGVNGLSEPHRWNGGLARSPLFGHRNGPMADLTTDRAAGAPL
jgi:serine acetyltransferase